MARLRGRLKFLDRLVLRGRQASAGDRFRASGTTAAVNADGAADGISFKNHIRRRGGRRSHGRWSNPTLELQTAWSAGG